MTGKQKAEYIEQIGNKFNVSISRKLTNLKYTQREVNEVELRGMIDSSIINVDRVVKIIYPRN